MPSPISRLETDRPVGVRGSHHVVDGATVDKIPLGPNRELVAVGGACATLSRPPIGSMDFGSPFVARRRAAETRPRLPRSYEQMLGRPNSGRRYRTRPIHPMEECGARRRKMAAFSCFCSAFASRAPSGTAPSTRTLDDGCNAMIVHQAGFPIYILFQFRVLFMFDVQAAWMARPLCGGRNGACVASRSQPKVGETTPRTTPIRA